jgi:hypothetical protein
MDLRFDCNVRVASFAGRLTNADWTWICDSIAMLGAIRWTIGSQQMCGATGTCTAMPCIAYGAL